MISSLSEVVGGAELLVMQPGKDVGYDIEAA
jgi:hypothetical protein